MKGTAQVASLIKSALARGSPLQQLVPALKERMRSQKASRHFLGGYFTHYSTCSNSSYSSHLLTDHTPNKSIYAKYYFRFRKTSKNWSANPCPTSGISSLGVQLGEHQQALWTQSQLVCDSGFTTYCITPTYYNESWNQMHRPLDQAFDSPLNISIKNLKIRLQNSYKSFNEKSQYATINSLNNISLFKKFF